MKTFNELALEYAPYHTMPAFSNGATDWTNRVYVNPYGEDGVQVQAWDRGAECAMRAERLSKHTRQHGRYA